VKTFSPRFQFILLLLLFASLLAVVFLNHSAWRGRLQYDIDYEDVITYLDGLKRYRALVDQPQGHLQFVYQYVTDPPHAPLHSFQAAVAFAVFGIQDWAPYASNGILLFLLFLAFVYSAKQFGGWALVVGLGYLALAPLAYNTIAEFRPDYPSAILTVWGVLFYLDFLRSGKLKFCALAGASYGLAMLAKPPVFLYVMAIGGGPFFLGLAMGLRESRWAGLVGAVKNVHVDDVARAFGKSLGIQGRDANYRVFNIAAGSGHSVAEVLELIGRATGREVRLEQSDFGKAALGLLPRVVLANGKAREDLGWEPEIGLEEGVRRMMRHSE
jgi:hypothetical protein